RSPGWTGTTSGPKAVVASGCMLHLFVRRTGVVVRRARVVGDLDEVVGDGRRLRLPLIPGGVPRVVPGHLAPEQRDGEVDEDEEQPEREHRGAGGGRHVQRLE